MAWIERVYIATLHLQDMIASGVLSCLKAWVISLAVTGDPYWDG
jgi:hypothetical protein